MDLEKNGKDQQFSLCGFLIFTVFSGKNVR